MSHEFLTACAPFTLPVPPVRKPGRKPGQTQVSLWLPKEMLRAIDEEVAAHDTDRSKFVRSAIRRAIAELPDRAEWEARHR